jgi:transposase
MKETDLRKQPDDVRNYMRKRAIRLMKAGKTQQEIADNFGVHLNTVGSWWRNYQKEGKKALHVNKRGLKSGQGRLLTAEQEKEIQKMIIDKTPDQLKLPFVLWDRKAVKELIQSQYGVNVAIRTIGDYLLRWNFSPQRPVKRAYEQQPQTVQRWLDEVYPEIQIKAKREDAEIHWGDETGFRNDHHYGRGYSPRGKTPVVRLSAKRVSTNMISSITNQGKVRFMIYSKSMNAQVLIKFLKRLIKSSDRKIFLILDNLKVHHAILVREWLEGKEDKLEIFFLPSYSPELNPDEYLNNDIKQGIHSKSLFRDEKSLKKGVLSHMRMLQKMPKRVMNYFKHPKIAYAG